MPDATLDDFSALVRKVHMGEFPLLPQPSWGQDAAYLAFVMDGMVNHIVRLRSVLMQLRDWDMIATPGATGDGDWARRLIADALGQQEGGGASDESERY